MMLIGFYNISIVLQITDVEFSETQKTLIQKSLDSWSNVSGIVEVIDNKDSYGDLRFIQLDFDKWG